MILTLNQMISILLWCTLSLISTSINAQQVYEQHYVETNQSPHNVHNYQQPNHALPQQQQQQVVQHPQYNNLAQHQYVQQQQQQQPYPTNNVGPSPSPGSFLNQQPIPMFQAMPSGSPMTLDHQAYHDQPQYQQGPTQYPPQPQMNQPLPVAMNQGSSNSGGFMQRMGFAPPPQHNSNYMHHMNMQGIPMSPHHEFTSRRGPPPHEKRRGKPPPNPRYSNKRKDMGPPIKMMDMNRIPKPPKYPLYDMGSLSMATPPPPPVMHPMAQVPSNSYATFVKSPRDGRPPPPHHHHPPRGRGKPRRGPPKKHMQKQKHRPERRPPPPNPRSRAHRKPPPHDKKHAVSQGFDHPMASNMDPLVDSPSLGRPLSFDEYMERPSHSFTNDPWNFDPFAAKYNSGMNTYAMKYNYDPLGMNSLDKSQSHLDPNKLSYPGDYYTQDASITPGVDSNPHGVKSSQIGGWDQSPDSYRDRTPQSELLPPLTKHVNKQVPRKQQQQHHHQPSSSHRTSESQNSFNVYEDNADDVSVVKAETINPLKLLSDANPGIEFSLESADGSDSGIHGSGSGYQQSKPSYYSESLHNLEPLNAETEWNSYPQTQLSYQDSGPAYSEQVSMRHDDVMFDQPAPSRQQYEQHHQQQQQQPYQNHADQYQQPSNIYNNYPQVPQQQQHQQQQPAQQQHYPHASSPSRHDYENAPSSHTYDDEAQQNTRKQDYVHHEAPYSNLSDHFSPGYSDLNTDLLPPHENAPIFKRTGGARMTRHEKTPMVELEGLSLFKDILNNHNAIGARNQLFKVLK